MPPSLRRNVCVKLPDVTESSIVRVVFLQAWLRRSVLEASPIKKFRSNSACVARKASNDHSKNMFIFRVLV